MYIDSTIPFKQTVLFCFKERMSALCFIFSEMSFTVFYYNILKSLILLSSSCLWAAVSVMSYYTIQLLTFSDSLESFFIENNTTAKWQEFTKLV